MSAPFLSPEDMGRLGFVDGSWEGLQVGSMKGRPARCFVMPSTSSPLTQPPSFQQIIYERPGVLNLALTLLEDRTTPINHSTHRRHISVKTTCRPWRHNDYPRAYVYLKTEWRLSTTSTTTLSITNITAVDLPRTLNAARWLPYKFVTC